MQIFSGFVITGHVRGGLTESGRQGSRLQVTENEVNSNRLQYSLWKNTGISLVDDIVL